MQERVALELLALLEEINKAGPHVLLGHEFWDLLDSFAVADGRSIVGVLLLADALGIFVDSFSDEPPVADERPRVVVLLLANELGIRRDILLEACEGVCAVVVHGGLGDGHVDVGRRHFNF